MRLTSQIDEVIQDIERDQNLIRIKKLMVYACTNVWQGNPHQLDRYTLRNLIQQLFKVAPSLEDLRSYLYRLVSTLNKQAEYTLVANSIVHYLKDLYAQQRLPALLSAEMYPAIAETLQRDPDSLRIKKLLFCVCKSHWQNDPALLDQVLFVDLVQDIHQFAPTMDDLTMMLSGIVATLNRQAVYTGIKVKVIDAFAPLYAAVPDSVSFSLPSGNQPGDQSANLTTNQAADQTKHQSFSPNEQEAPIPPAPASNPPRPSSRSIATADLFDLRLELAKYSTPLRTKILLFSLLRQHLDWSGHDYSILKPIDLNLLLQELFHSYGNLNELEPRLKTTAYGLNPSQDYMQTANMLLRVLKLWYDKRTPSDRAPDRPSEIEPTDVKSNESETTNLT